MLYSVPSVSSSVDDLEPGLQVINNTLIKLESPGKNFAGYIRNRAKHRISKSNHSRILATESCNGDSFAWSNISLVMNQTNRECKHITLLQHLGDVPVLGAWCDEPDFKATFENCQDFRGSRMSVGRVSAPRSIVNTDKWNAKSVESW